MNYIYIIIFVLGFVAGMYISRYFTNDELNTDKCIEYLRKQNLWININVKPDGKQ